MSRMYNPPHPGAILGELWFEPLGLSITAAANKLQVSRKTLSEIVNQRAAISPDMALRLSDLLGTSAELWLGMQSAYDLWQAEQKPRPVVQRVEMEAHA